MRPCLVFEKLLAYHCAPTLMGIKPASLISCTKENLYNPSTIIATYNTLLSKKGIFIKTLFECDKRILLLVYHKKDLQNVMKTKQIRSFLNTVGYKHVDQLDDMLYYLTYRLSISEGFPHEIGLFLGYPLQDVIGFIENKGKNYKVCGYWKVYCNEHDTRELFEKYTLCKNTFCKQLNLGMSITEQLKIA